MKSDNYIKIHGWMMNDLKLSGNDLLVYALIHGFSNEEDAFFNGSLSYISKSLNIGRATTIRVLNKLTKNKLIIKENIVVNHVQVNKYSTCKEGSLKMIPPVSKRDGGSLKMRRGDGIKMRRGGSLKMIPNNTIVYNTIKDITNLYMSSIKIEDLKTEKLKEYFLIADSFRKRFIETLESEGISSKRVKEAKCGSWIKPIELMIEKDEITKKQLSNVWQYLDHKNDKSQFWRKNIQTTSKLRKQINRLIIESNEKTKSTTSTLEKTKRVFEKTDGFSGYL